MLAANKRTRVSTIATQGFKASGIPLPTACATITSGTTRTASIETTPPGATCRVKRVNGSKVVASLVSSPGIIELAKSKHDVRVESDKDRHETGVGYLDSGTEEATLGNILPGKGLFSESP